MKIKVSEHALQTLIIHWLQAHRYYVMRLNSGRIRTEKGYMVKLGEVGTPDIMAFKEVKQDPCFENGEEPRNCDKLNLVFIEVKTPNNPKPTFAQEQKMKELEEYGARCLVIHSLEELEDQL